MTLMFRPAAISDVDAAVPLIYSAGVEAFEYAFTTGKCSAGDFLAFAFKNGGGIFGWSNHTVAVLDQQVVGIVAGYSGREYFRLTFGTTCQIFRRYSLWSHAQVVHHSLQLSALMPRPAWATHYVANFAVSPLHQGLGIGTAMLDDQQKVAVLKGRTSMTLDVSADNPRGQKLYERLGFCVTKENTFSGPANTIANSRRMERSLLSVT